MATRNAKVSPPVEWKADDGSRTRDLELGKLALYQLSYVRVGGLILGIDGPETGDIDPFAAHRRDLGAAGPWGWRRVRLKP
jgi:hypothetical protein